MGPSRSSSQAATKNLHIPKQFAYLIYYIISQKMSTKRGQPAVRQAILGPSTLTRKHIWPKTYFR